MRFLPRISHGLANQSDVQRLLLLASRQGERPGNNTLAIIVCDSLEAVQGFIHEVGPDFLSSVAACALIYDTKEITCDSAWAEMLDRELLARRSDRKWTAVVFTTFQQYHALHALLETRRPFARELVIFENSGGQCRPGAAPFLVGEVPFEAQTHEGRTNKEEDSREHAVKRSRVR